MMKNIYDRYVLGMVMVGSSSTFPFVIEANQGGGAGGILSTLNGRPLFLRTSMPTSMSVIGGTLSGPKSWREKLCFLVKIELKSIQNFVANKAKQLKSIGIQEENQTNIKCIKLWCQGSHVGSTLQPLLHDQRKTEEATAPPVSCKNTDTQWLSMVLIHNKTPRTWSS